MRTMLLSFRPEWYEKIKNGTKIFEYRSSFSTEEVMAYMYVSTPVKSIVGKIHLGKRMEIAMWKDEYGDDKEVMERIEEFVLKRRYVMPILSFQLTEAISLEELRAFDSKFVSPQMYYYLDNYPKLSDHIKENAIDIGEIMENDFRVIDKDDICRIQY